MKIGDKVTLKNSQLHSDWRNHEGEVGTIDSISSTSRRAGYTISILWSDGVNSHCPPNNIEIVEEMSEFEIGLKNIIKDLKGG